MDCLATYRNGILIYHTNNMIANIESDSDYLFLPKSFSHATALFIFGNDP